MFDVCVVTTNKVRKTNKDDVKILLFIHKIEIYNLMDAVRSRVSENGKWLLLGRSVGLQNMQKNIIADQSPDGDFHKQ